MLRVAPIVVCARKRLASVAVGGGVTTTTGVEGVVLPAGVAVDVPPPPPPQAASASNGRTAPPVARPLPALSIVCPSVSPDAADSGSATCSSHPVIARPFRYGRNLCKPPVKCRERG